MQRTEKPWGLVYITIPLSHNNLTASQELFSLMQRTEKPFARLLLFMLALLLLKFRLRALVPLMVLDQ